MTLERWYFACMCALMPTALKHAGVSWARQSDRPRFESLLSNLLAVSMRVSYLNSLNLYFLITIQEESQDKT